MAFAEHRVAEDEELWVDEGGDDYEGWFCVSTDPFPCPAFGCAFVAEFMTARLETVRETDTLAFALHKMDSGGYRHLPVLRDGQLTGMISVRDVLRHITRLCKPPGPIP